MGQTAADFSDRSGPWGLHWFRRDLRIAGNEALRFNFKKTQGRTLGFFCFDSKFLSRSDFSHNRFALFIETLKALQDELRLQGGDLLVVDCQPHEAFKKLLRFIDEGSLQRPQILTFNRDYEPYARKRDEAVIELLKQEKIEVATFRDHLFFEPHEILKTEKADSYYQVYSPYGKKWFSQLQTTPAQERLKAQASIHQYYSNLEKKSLEIIFKLSWKQLLKQGTFPFHDALEEFEKKNKTHLTISLPPAGSLAAYKSIHQFKKNISDYKEKRDFPSVQGTSRLSYYLKNGSIVSSQVIHALELKQATFAEGSGESQYLKEIVWREFYYSILYHRPDVETQSFLPQFRDLQWENDEKLFQRWIDGMTGFPIVDAGMRELKETGWMHNRVRMIVASFLTKDLLIDWKWGENYFMKALLDGDIAPNNGGWQWAASTGCDPQPYFRIFNPWLQGEKFDPDAVYIKKWIPELQSISAKNIHDPEGERGFRYPKPCVNHKVQKEKALLLYKALTK